MPCPTLDLRGGARRMRSPGCCARESEAGLAALSVDHLAGDHLKMPLVLAVAAADVAAIKPNHDGFAWPRRRRLRRCRDMRQHNGLTDSHVLLRTVLAFAAPLTASSSDSRFRDLARRRQRRIPRRYIGQFGRHRRGLEVEGSEALCSARPVTETSAQATGPNWHVAEQRAECRGVMSLAGQNAPARDACAAATALGSGASGGVNWRVGSRWSPSWDRGRHASCGRSAASGFIGWRWSPCGFPGATWAALCRSSGLFRGKGCSGGLPASWRRQIAGIDPRKRDEPVADGLCG
jgi:hypothetical protein